MKSIHYVGLVLFTLILALVLLGVFVSRESIHVTDYATGTMASAPYAVQGKGIVLTRIPERVFLVETSSFGQVRAPYDQTCLAQLRMTPAELESDLKLWATDDQITAIHADVSDRSRPDSWPAWFPATSPENYVATVKTPHGWTVSIFRQPGDDEHVYFVY